MKKFGSILLLTLFSLLNSYSSFAFAGSRPISSLKTSNLVTSQLNREAISSNLQKSPQINSLVRQDFNAGKILPGLGLQNWTSNTHAFQIVPDTDPQHGLVARIAFNRSDVAGTTGSRVELFDTTHFQQEHRYLIHWDVKLAPNYQFDFKQLEIIGQIHQFSNDGSPPFSILLQGNHYIASIKTDKMATAQNFPIGDARPGVWENWTLDWRPSAGSNGFYRLYRDGKEVLNFRGQTAYAEPDAGYFKLGLYKWNWHTTLPSDATVRVLYLDNILVSEIPG